MGWAWKGGKEAEVRGLAPGRHLCMVSRFGFQELLQSSPFYSHLPQCPSFKQSQPTSPRTAESKKMTSAIGKTNLREPQESSFLSPLPKWAVVPHMGSSSQNQFFFSESNLALKHQRCFAMLTGAPILNSFFKTRANHRIFLKKKRRRVRKRRRRERQKPVDMTYKILASIEAGSLPWH